MRGFTEIDFLEFKRLRVQVIASIFSCDQIDSSLKITLQTREPGSIELHKNYDGTRYVFMYVPSFDMSLSHDIITSKHDEIVQICLNKVAKIKNLKSIAFPFYGHFMVQKFVDDNPNIKVYILLKSHEMRAVDYYRIISEKEDYYRIISEKKDENVVEKKDCVSPHLSFGDLLGQIKIWKNNKSGWAPFFVDRIDDKTIGAINKFLQDESKKCAIYPEPKKIFNAMILTKLTDIKVIIIGQDPYHTPGAAMGLAFSHEKDCKKIQPSLQNIYEELISCGYKVNAKSGDLTKWTQQGVFLINTALTVQQGKPNSHSKEWEKFTEKLFTFMNEKIKRSVVIMWGAHAQSYEKYFDATRHEMIKSPHPSPFSAHKGFFGSKPFIMCNKQLKKWGMEEIDWNLNVEKTYRIVEDTKTGKNMYQCIEGDTVLSKRIYCCYRNGGSEFVDCDCECDACDH